MKLINFIAVFGNTGIVRIHQPHLFKKMRCVVSLALVVLILGLFCVFVDAFRFKGLQSIPRMNSLLSSRHTVTVSMGSKKLALSASKTTPPSDPTSQDGPVNKHLRTGRSHSRIAIARIQGGFESEMTAIMSVR
jgi:hypothetical protein